MLQISVLKRGSKLSIICKNLVADIAWLRTAPCYESIAIFEPLPTDMGITQGHGTTFIDMV